MTPFAQRYRALAAERGQLCVGIGATGAVDKHWDLPPGPDGLRLLARRVLAAAGRDVTAFKLHTGFFERFGGDGLAVMRETADAAHAAGALVIADAKRGEAPDVAAATAALYLGPDSVVGADALVVHPYLGFRALGALFAEAAGRGCGVFVLARTSNDGGEEVQLARLPDGRTVAQYVVDAVVRANDSLGVPVAGVVVGAPADEAARLFRRAAGALVNLPGLGRTGRDVAQFRGIVGAEPERAVLPVTSGILAAGPDPGPLRETIARWAAALTATALRSG
jgi:orotidine-5'-phosphate decarboxylase